MLKALLGLPVGLFLIVGAFWGGDYWSQHRSAWHVGICSPIRIVCIGWDAGSASQIADLKTAFSTEQNSVHALQGALDRQNAAVLGLATQADTWQARSKAAVSRAASANAWRLDTATKISRETLPTGADKCAAAEALLRGAAR